MVFIDDFDPQGRRNPPHPVHIRNHRRGDLPNGNRPDPFPMNLTPTLPPIPAPAPAQYEPMRDPHPTMPLSAGEFGPRLPMPDLRCAYCNTQVRWSNALSRFMSIHPSGGKTCPERPRLIGYRPHSVIREPRPLGTLLITIGVVLATLALAVWLVA